MTSWWSLCEGPSYQALLPSSRPPQLLVSFFLLFFLSLNLTMVSTF